MAAVLGLALRRSGWAPPDPPPPPGRPPPAHRGSRPGLPSAGVHADPLHNTRTAAPSVAMVGPARGFGAAVVGRGRRPGGLAGGGLR